MKKLLVLAFALFLVACSSGPTIGDIVDYGKDALLYVAVQEDALVAVESIKYIHVNAKLNEDYQLSPIFSAIEAYEFYIIYENLETNERCFAVVSYVNDIIEDYQVMTSEEVLNSQYSETVAEINNSINNASFLLVYDKFDVNSGELDSDYLIGINPKQKEIDNYPSRFDVAINLLLNTNTLVTFTNEIEEVYYEFTPTISGDYTIFSLGENDTYVELYDDSEVMISEDDDQGDNYNFLLTDTFVANQTYYFIIGNYDSAGTTNIRIVAGNYNDYLIESAVEIEEDEVVNLNISNTKLEGVFSFTPTISGDYTFFTTSDYYVEMVLYTQTGNILRETSGNASTQNVKVTYNVSAGVTYYLKVSAPNDEIASLSIHLVEGDGPQSAPFQNVFPIIINQTISVNIGSSFGEMVILSFTPTLSGNYTIYSNDTTGIDPYASIYNEYRIELAYDDDISYSNPNFSLTYYLEANQTYYYKIGAWDTNITFSVYLVLN